MKKEKNKNESNENPLRQLADRGQSPRPKPTYYPALSLLPNFRKGFGTWGRIIYASVVRPSAMRS